MSTYNGFKQNATKEARLVLLAFDELDIILVQQSHHAEEAIAARKAPRLPENLPSHIAPPLPVDSRPLEEDDSRLTDPDPTQTLVFPPKTPGLRLKGPDFRQLIAQKTQKLLNEKALQLRVQGLDSEALEPAACSAAADTFVSPWNLEEEESDVVNAQRGEETDGGACGNKHSINKSSNSSANPPLSSYSELAVQLKFIHLIVSQWK